MIPRVYTFVKKNIDKYNTGFLIIQSNLKILLSFKKTTNLN